MLHIFKNERNKEIAGQSAGQVGKNRSNRWLIATLSVLVITPLALYALNPSYAPGGNFDMEYWNLQLPVGSSGSPTIIPSSQS
jgi:hypothetical protein